MQGNLMWLPRVRGLAGAGVLALGMVAVLSTPTFAKGLPLNESGLSPARVSQSLVVSQDAEAVGDTTGVVIVAVDAAGPAAQAGIERGDILVKAGDVEINAAVALFEVVTAAKPGDTVELLVLHGDEQRTISVVLGAVAMGQGGERAYLGVQVADAPVDSAGATAAMPAVESPPVVDVQILTPTVATATAVAAPAMGLIVAEVMADGPAALAGVEAGDVIAAMDGVPVFSADDFINALKGHTPGEVVLLTVQKSGSAEAVVAQIPVTLGGAPDDPARAYLGIRILSPEAGVTIEMAPPTEGFTAPAMPMMPAIPAYPEMAPGYAYPAYPGAVAGAYPGEACGTTIINNYYYYAPAADGATFSVPVSPRPFAAPAVPAAPVYIYQQGVNPEVYGYPATGEVEKNMIFFRGEPAMPGGETQSFGIQLQPGMAAPATGEVEKNMIFFRGEPAMPGGETQSFEIQLQPGMAPVLPSAVDVQKQGNVVIVRKDVGGANVTVTGVAGSGMATDVVTQEGVTQKDVVTVQGQAAPSAVWATPVDPSAGVAVPQVAPLPAVPFPAEDGWY